MGHQIAGMYPTLIVVIVSFNCTTWEDSPVAAENGASVGSLRLVVSSSGLTDTVGTQRAVDIHLNPVISISREHPPIDKHPLPQIFNRQRSVSGGRTGLWGQGPFIHSLSKSSLSVFNEYIRVYPSTCSTSNAPGLYQSQPSIKSPGPFPFLDGIRMPVNQTRNTMADWLSLDKFSRLSARWKRFRFVKYSQNLIFQGDHRLMCG
ncbi:hypothetical protein K438DRAFT_1762975 [Mycena galopus ATCC 62051]|nr:hypothetical protein K438DRAFT_1762975 [Mycena galopus ATCC 62051]